MPTSRANKPAKPRIAVRKRPSQQRSTQLVSDILEAAIRVLTREGATRFTTARVAEAAGVSVGSLYQYFPNKAAILFRLQSDEWTRTLDLMTKALLENRREPLARLAPAIRLFFRTEWEEAALRRALDDAAPWYREAPESAEHRAVGEACMQRYVDLVLPGVRPARRTAAMRLLLNTMGTMGKQASEDSSSLAEVDAQAREVGFMLTAYIERMRAELE